jgi:hypothetical protein
VVELEVRLSGLDGRKLARLSETIDEISAEQGLSIRMKKPVAKFSGSIHWHLKKGRERGTLEVTLLPVKRGLWFSMHENRSADWVMYAAHEFQRRIEAE